MRAWLKLANPWESSLISFWNSLSSFMVRYSGVLGVTSKKKELNILFDFHTSVYYYWKWRKKKTSLGFIWSWFFGTLAEKYIGFIICRNFFGNYFDFSSWMLLLPVHFKYSYVCCTTNFDWCRTIWITIDIQWAPWVWCS